MRWLVLLALALTPASAQAGTIAREGTELVYRSAPGEADQVNFENLQPTLVAEGRVTAGRAVARARTWRTARWRV